LSDKAVRVSIQKDFTRLITSKAELLKLLMKVLLRSALQNQKIFTSQEFFLIGRAS